ncbi:MAG: DVU_1557 family redox protein [Clostridiaceae bacterium]
MKAEFYDNKTKWICGQCGAELKPGKVKLKYLEGIFDVDLLKCPSCGLVLITEDLAVGKMLEVEKSLEDK